MIRIGEVHSDFPLWPRPWRYTLGGCIGMNAFHNLRQHGIRGILLRILPESLLEQLRRNARNFEHWRQRDLIAIWKKDVESIVEKYEGIHTVFLFPPSLSWNAQLFQRPQQLASALARAGALVFYLEPRESSVKAGLHCLETNIYLCRVPLAVFNGLNDPLIYILTWNRGYLHEIPQGRVLYDYVDHLDVFHYHDRSGLLNEHKQLLSKAAYVTATSRALLAEVETIRPDALYLPNAVDFNHFQPDAETGDETPAELEPLLERGKPIIGYYGALAEWIDYELLIRLAIQRTDLNFLFIGPDYDGSMEKSGLDSPQNVHILGARAYQKLPNYLQAFDVATIPFRLSHVTHAVSPLKLFEYMAGGKPVVATPMEEVMRYEGVLIGANAEQFSERIDEALRLAQDESYLESIKKVAQENIWSARAWAILQEIGRR